MSAEKSLNDYTRKELLALPLRRWDQESEYDSLMLVPDGRKHDSGWAIVAVIGVRKYAPQEIAAQNCDDLEWITPAAEVIELRSGPYECGRIRMDCAFKSKAMHFWSQTHKFIVGTALSSTKIRVIEK